ncbi:transposase [Bradyrhizobium sp. USDA 4463]
MDTVHTAITEPVRRLEVFTGAGRRRKWSDEDKARIVAEIVASGDSVCSVARAAPSRFCGLRRICWICCSWFFPCDGGLCAAKSRHNLSNAFRNCPLCVTKNCPHHRVMISVEGCFRR